MDYKKKKLESAIEEFSAKKTKAKKSKLKFLPSIIDLKRKWRTFNYKTLFDVGTTNGKIFLISFTIIVSVIIHQIVNSISLDMFSRMKDDLSDYIPKRSILPSLKPSQNRPTYWTYVSDSDDEKELKHVHTVLDRLGLQQGTNSSDWDFMWSYDTFDENVIGNLKPHQKINRFPGGSLITNKEDLIATNNVYNYIPKSFKLPADQQALLEFSRLNPYKLYIQRISGNDEIMAKSYEEIDTTLEGSYVQEFIGNPLLIDGHKFDVGVYAIVTGIDPLRIYVYRGDVFVRFCPEAFFPFDATNPEKYVAKSTYLSTWKIPEFSQYNQLLGFGMKDSIRAYMRNSYKININSVWPKIEDAIRLIVLERESTLAGKRQNQKSNFFEIIRFDVIVDDTYNVHVIDAEMNPIRLTDDLKEHEILYEQVLYNFLNLIGIGSSIDRESFKNGSISAESMISSNKNVAVYPEKCVEPPCSESCTAPECELCLKCMSKETIAAVHAAYREHIHRGETRRIFPFPIADYELDEDIVEVLNPKNQMLSRWFYGKCLMDSAWCT